MRFAAIESLHKGTVGYAGTDDVLLATAVSPPENSGAITMKGFGRRALEYAEDQMRRGAWVRLRTQEQFWGALPPLLLARVALRIAVPHCRECGHPRGMV